EGARGGRLRRDPGDAGRLSHAGPDAAAATCGDCRTPDFARLDGLSAADLSAMRPSLLSVPLLAALSLAGCQSLPQEAPRAGAAATPVEAGTASNVADDNLNAVLWVQASA